MLVVEGLATILGLAATALLLALVAFPLVQTLWSLGSAQRPAPRGDGPRPRVAILVPAHDEAVGLPATLATLLPQLGPDDRLVVIADNCSDQTASVARSLGAEAIERFDPVQRGKSYALDFGLEHLRADPPAVVLMFDADCVAAPDCVAILAAEAIALNRPIQARYLIRAPNDGAKARISEFAYRLRSWVRPLGMQRVGMPCQLMGCGMAFHWTLIEPLSLASGHLTEDMLLGLTLARRRLYPTFCPEAIVDSRLVADAADAVVQRTRWEHGALATIFAELPSLLVQAARTLDLRLFMMALDLAVPPLALLSSLLLVYGVVSVAVTAIGGPVWPLVSFLAALCMQIAMVVIVQRVYARDLIRLREIFLEVPLYLLRKLPVYVRFVFQRQVEWVRAKRDAG
jgi:cellulose synthase/poly-beta-1,6-N-acetylglucosamine synthase-like glycosyltransferase